MNRTTDEWNKIFPTLDATNVSAEDAIANRIIGDLYGYRHTSKHRPNDIKSLSNALIAYAKLIQEAGVKIT